MRFTTVRILLCLACLLAASIVSTNGQTPPPETKEEPQQEFAIKVGVEEVRIDAVVLDNKGRQITDLTGEDFKLFQDGKPQKINSCIYVADSQSQNKIFTSPEASEAELMVSTPLLPMNGVRRTIAFLYNQTYEARMSLQKYVESEMEAGDLVAILGAVAGVGALQRFSSDKRELLSRIKNLHIVMPPPSSNPWARGSPGYVYVPADASLSYEDRQKTETRNRMLGAILAERRDTDEQYIRRLKAKIAPIRYAVRALQDMPGRKYLIFMSDDIYYDSRRLPAVQERLFNEAANEALRAGVVIFTLDTKGLNVWQKTSAPEKHIPLSKKTGGIIVEGSNFFLHGIKPVEEAMSGYYLLSYVPPENTFDENHPVYHRIRVKVNLSGGEVHTRDGFFGSSHSANFASVPQTNALQQAIFSPFLYNDLKVSLYSGYAHAPTPGYFLGSWLHLEGKDLTFKQESNGKHLLSLELAALTSDSNGRIQDSKGFYYDFRLSDSEVSRIRKNGMDLNTWLPIKNPGDYYVRAAIRDKASGKIGSGYQFLQIPDLSRSGLSLSSIFILNQPEDASAIRSGNIDEKSSVSNSMRNWQTIGRSPALRSYLPGEGFDYMAVIYNARTKHGQPHKLEVMYKIFRDGKEYLKGNPEDIDLTGVHDFGGIPVMKRLSFDTRMSEGTYVFQLVVTDKQNKSNTAAEAIDFEIRRPD
jgi:VWFA-related protein